MPSPRAHPLCDANVTDLRQALYDCDERCRCSTAESPNFKPSRLLDLNEWSSSHTVRLISPFEMSQLDSLQYAALTYCWGSRQEALHQSKTTVDTIEAHYQSIPAGSLSAVVKDAIRVTQALSLRYLWVDALCITQGDHAEWVRESGQMDLVYSNAYVTICAASSSSCLEGFLDRKAPIKIKFFSSNCPDMFRSLNLRKIPGHRSRSALDIYSQEVSQTAWNTRGWTLQEHCLSRRVLSFGPRRTILECSERVWVESLGYVTVGPINCGFKGSMQHSGTVSDTRLLYNKWSLITSSFSRRLLTEPRDWLPALSGIAKCLALQSGDQYVAGLWKGDLIAGLLWRTYHGALSIDEISRIPTNLPYIGPTWSWAHCGGISTQQTNPAHLFLSEDDKPWLVPECKILDAYSKPENPRINPWGRIVEAHLKLLAKSISISGRLVRARQDDSLLDCFTFVWQEHTTFIITPDFAISTGLNEWHIESAILVLLASHRTYGDLLEDIRGHADCSVSDKSPNSWIYAAHSDSTREPEEDRCAVGLLLHPISSGRYVRIGHFTSGPIQGGLHAFKDAPRKVHRIV